MSTKYSEQIENFKVSILTPTFPGRRWFVRLLGRMILNQTFNLKQIEWIILEDQEEEEEEQQQRQHDIFYEVQQELGSFKYIQLNGKRPIGKKRNICNLLARGEILINMDDDDFYGPLFVSAIVEVFELYPQVRACGSQLISFVYPDSPELQICGPYGLHRTCNGILSCRKSYAETHYYDNRKTFAEESDFLNNFTEPIFEIQRPEQIYFAVAHSNNTVSKINLIRRPRNLSWPYVFMEQMKKAEINPRKFYMIAAAYLGKNYNHHLDIFLHDHKNSRFASELMKMIKITFPIAIADVLIAISPILLKIKNDDFCETTTSVDS